MIDCPLCGHDIPPSDDLVLDMNTGTMVVGGRALHLPQTEAWVLELLKEKYPRTVSSRSILEYISSSAHEPSPSIVKLYICRLRQRLVGSTWRISTTYKVGYRLVRQPAPEE